MDRHEAQRLAALTQLDILDTAPEAQFDELVRLAAWICEVPMAAVSLVDSDRQWFKARIGLSVAQTPRSDAFCAHTISQRDVLEVVDAARDPRFAQNPLVLGEPGIRFYAAAPLVTPDDLAVGTLCVLDRVPRHLDPTRRWALGALAGQVMAQIVLRMQVATTQRLEERFRAVVEQSPNLIVLVDATGVIRYASPAATPILGYGPNDLLGRGIGTLFDASLAEQAIARSLASAPGERSGPFELPIRRRDGSTGHVEVRSTNLLGLRPVEAVVVTCRDVSAQRELVRAREQAAIALETANDAFIQIDERGQVIVWNRQAERTFGWSRDEAIGQPVAELIIPPRSRVAHRRGVLRSSRRIDRVGEPIFDNLAVTAVRRDGVEIPVEVTMWPTATSAEGARFSAFVRDITERRALEERLVRGALHDDLTGLPNRQLLRDRLDRALVRAARTGRRVGVLFCDLDRFKVVNDSTGHSAGDEVLRVVADRLTRTVRDTDTVVRFGGDEFVVVVDSMEDELEATTLADRIRVAIAEPIVVDDVELPTSISIGVVIGDAGSSAEQLVSDADAAMYVAKERGRDRVEVFDDSLRRRAQTRLDDERALRRALEAGELRLDYQPIVSVASGTIVGAEALLRWHRADVGVVPPARFVPLAEETGLILPIGAWVLREACLQLREWQDLAAGSQLTMSVNVAARQVASGSLVAAVGAALDAAGVEARDLTLELTESALMENLEHSRSALGTLQRAGVRLAIDDFGTGYSSLSYLKSLPIDVLKIDRSFVVNLVSDPYDSAIVTAISTIARSLGLYVIAEGVETVEQLDRVIAHGCAAVQGYHLARPMPAAALAQLLGTTFWPATGVAP